MNRRLLTTEDVKGVEADDDGWTSMEYLTAVCSVSYNVSYQQQGEGRSMAAESEKKDERVSSYKKLDGVPRGSAKRENQECRPYRSYYAAVDIYKEEVRSMINTCQGDRPHRSTALDISRGERKMGDKSLKMPMIKKREEGGLSKEEKLKREKLLKRPVTVENTKTTKRVRSELNNTSSEKEGEIRAISKAKAKKRKKNNSDSNRGRSSSMNHGPERPPDLPKDVENEILRLGGSNVKLVIQKGLYPTDLKDNHNRLSIPARTASKGFLTEDEEKRHGNHNGYVESMDVKLIEPKGGDPAILSFRRWNMKKKSGKSSACYVLTSNWNAVKKRNGLKEKMVIQLWSFRVQGELWFALVLVDIGEGSSSSSSGGNESGASSSHAGASTSSASPPDRDNLIRSLIRDEETSLRGGRKEE
ncbi:hypothetical protein RJ640_004549 [Escallonia rubra]|uniref:B3 domain-containing protein n=1 Tax=Escallonia rubra TaxID=112253 RepID=A0AA88R8L1_9ASTE|nr:hypothetical protein RJ640_004549 [Escallonia rubra]